MIEPALTPEEWAHWGDPLTKHGFITGCQDEGLNGHDGSAHMIAALALNGEPFGFSWEDVDLLRGVRLDFPEDVAGMGSIIDRIAALLPPRQLDVTAGSVVTL